MPLVDEQTPGRQGQLRKASRYTGQWGQIQLRRVHSVCARKSRKNYFPIFTVGCQRAQAGPELLGPSQAPHSQCRKYRIHLLSGNLPNRSSDKVATRGTGASLPATCSFPGRCPSAEPLPLCLSPLSRYAPGS